jgi:hypothetical protein
MSIVEHGTKPRWDYAAYAAIPSDGKRHEIITAEHFVNPAPSLYHQEVSRQRIARPMALPQRLPS